jgi:SAM-dependent methyltransferase
MSDFNPIASALRQSLVEYYRVSAERVPLAGWHDTLETNSGYVERRSRPLIALYLRASEQRSLEGIRALDAGCGFGAMSVYLGWRRATVVGVDVNGRRLAVGREVAGRFRLPVTFRRSRIEEIDADDEAFDLVVLNNSLCYVVEPDRRRLALSEVNRVLRPGAHAVLRNPNHLALRDPFTGLPGLNFLPPRPAARLARVARRDRSAVLVLTPGGARRELERAGFSDVRHVSSPASRRPKLFASYQHLVASRPAPKDATR